MKNLIKKLLVLAIVFNSASSFGADLKTLENQKIALAADIAKLEDALSKKVLSDGEVIILNEQEGQTHAIYHMILRVEALITLIGVAGTAGLQVVHTPEMADGSLLQKGYIDNLGNRRILSRELQDLEGLLVQLSKSGASKSSYIDLVGHYKHIIANVENSLVALTKVKEFDPVLRYAIEKEVKGSADYAQRLYALEKSAGSWTPEKSKELIKIIREQKSFFSKLAREISPKILPLVRKAIKIQNGKLVMGMILAAGVISGLATLVIGQWDFSAANISERSANDIGAELTQKMGEYIKLDEKTLELVMQRSAY
jgi:hypothetical protein